MRILLALITVFAVFQAQAYCYITGSNETPTRVAEPVTIDLDLAQSGEKAINFVNSAPDFKCLNNIWRFNTFTLSTTGTSEEYYYAIKNGIHNIVIGISLTSERTNTSPFAGGSSYSITALDNQLKYKVKYRVIINHKDSINNAIEANHTFALEKKLILTPASCKVVSCLLGNDNTKQFYINEIPIRFKLTPTTCTFKSQEISAPSISYHEIDSNIFTTPTTKKPELQCSSITGVATSNIHYHFEPISMVHQSVILKNDLEMQQGGAGEVGFQLMNNGKVIDFLSSEKFTLANRGSALLNNAVYPLDLQLRYARYGNRVFAGKVQSKAKVVVDYD